MVYYISCLYWAAKARQYISPYFPSSILSSEQMFLIEILVQCATGKYKATLIRYSTAQISLDILGDLLSTYGRALFWSLCFLVTEKANR